MEYIMLLRVKQKTRFKIFGNIIYQNWAISPWMDNISVSATKKPYRSISNKNETKGNQLWTRNV